MCDFLGEGECVPTFTRESKRGPFVREVEKRNERWSEIDLLLIMGATENREMYVYKSTVESSGITEQFHWQPKAALWPREGRPRVSPCEPLCAIL